MCAFNVTNGLDVLSAAYASSSCQNIYKKIVFECQLNATSIARSIKTYLSNVHGGSEFAICFRGSFARKHALNNSDVDLACISATPSYQQDEKLKNILSKCVARNVSVYGFSVSFNSLPINSLVQWTTYNGSKFLTGSGRQFDRFLNNGNLALASMDIDDLRKLYYVDPLLSYQSNYSIDGKIGGIMHGIGGIVEYELSEICVRWEKLRASPINRYSNSLFNTIRRCYKYLVLYKYSCLSDQEGEFRDIINDKACLEVRKLAHAKFQELLF